MTKKIRKVVLEEVEKPIENGDTIENEEFVDSKQENNTKELDREERRAERNAKREHFKKHTLPKILAVGGTVAIAFMGGLADAGGKYVGGIIFKK